jgi:hypothetical protein
MSARKGTEDNMVSAFCAHKCIRRRNFVLDLFFYQQLLTQSGTSEGDWKQFEGRFATRAEPDAEPLCVAHTKSDRKEAARWVCLECTRGLRTRTLGGLDPHSPL